jgi:hypothetical protein
MSADERWIHQNTAKTTGNNVRKSTSHSQRSPILCFDPSGTTAPSGHGHKENHSLLRLLLTLTVGVGAKAEAEAARLRTTAAVNFMVNVALITGYATAL